MCTLQGWAFVILFLHFTLRMFSYMVPFFNINLSASLGHYELLLSHIFSNVFLALQVFGEPYIRRNLWAGLKETVFR